MKQNKLHFKKLVNYASFSNIEQVKSLFKTPENNWIFNHLKTEEKYFMCELVVNDNDIDFLQNFIEIRDMFEKIILLEYKLVAESFGKSKHSTLTQIDFSSEISENDVAVLIARERNQIKKCSVENIRTVLNILNSLPVSFCSKETKIKITLLHLCLYKDLVAANEIQLSEEVLEILLDILHFGEKIPLHKYVNFKTFLNLISPQKFPTFYTILFNNLKLDLENGKKFLSSLVAYIKKLDKEDEEFFELLNLSINYLCSPNAPKDTKESLDDLFKIVWKNVEEKFNKEIEIDMKSTSVFVEKSLPSFCNYFNAFFNKLEKNAEMEENMRKICKIYLGNSVSFC